MSDSIITVENLSKKYIISHKQEQRYTAMRDVLVNGVKGLGKKILGKGESGKTKEDFWALKDINFEIKQGDRVGIIGRNGAGKSTLLKVLSRITEPTSGKIHLRGRVASLLEVGTGFHPELTGRENIFLNGAIMGMSKWEIKKKFDEIVGFAEVEKFLDTPVKRYSSGMYVRLAFAVSAHLEPEILVVDEVLAVGDAAFQKKCLGKMEEVGKQGRTVLFVSHNMGLIQQLCNFGIMLDVGKMISIGKINKVIDAYTNGVGLDLIKESSFLREEHKNIWIKKVHIPNNVMNYSESILVQIEYEIYEKTQGVNFFINVLKAGVEVYSTYDVDLSEDLLKERNPGRYKSCICFPKMFFEPGIYSLRIGAGRIQIETILSHVNCITFEVKTDNIDITKKSVYQSSSSIYMPINWETENLV